MKITIIVEGTEAEAGPFRRLIVRLFCALSLKVRIVDNTVSTWEFLKAEGRGPTNDETHAIIP